MLLFRGADKTLKNFSNQDAALVAVVSGNAAMAALIKDYRPEDIGLSPPPSSPLFPLFPLSPSPLFPLSLTLSLRCSLLIVSQLSIQPKQPIKERLVAANLYENLNLLIYC